MEKHSDRNGQAPESCLARGPYRYPDHRRILGTLVPAFAAASVAVLLVDWLRRGSLFTLSPWFRRVQETAHVRGRASLPW